MKKTKDGRRQFSQEFKVAAIRRVENGEKQAKVARDLRIGVELLARWRRCVREGGEAALRSIGQRRLASHSQRGREGEAQIATLQRLVGKQQETIDFLEQALRRVEELRRDRKDSGATASSE